MSRGSLSILAVTVLSVVGFDPMLGDVVPSCSLSSISYWSMSEGARP